LVRCNVLCLGPEPRPLDRQGSTKILAQPEPSEKGLTQSLARWRHSTKLWRNLTPGWQKSLEAPQGCRRDRSGGISRGSVRVGRHCGGHSKGPAENRQILATSAYAALRRATIVVPPQAVADRS